MEKTERRITITGLVTLYEGDGIEEDGIEIITDDDTYIVELDYVGEELQQFLEKTIRATGFVTKPNGRRKKLEVDYFELEEEDEHIIDDDLDFPDDYFDSDYDYSNEYYLDDEY